MSKGEDNGIANGERLCARHREDCAKDSTCLNLPYPLFASGVTGHLRLRTEDGGNGGGSLRTSPTSQGDGKGFPRPGFVYSLSRQTNLLKYNYSKDQKK